MCRRDNPPHRTLPVFAGCAPEVSLEYCYVRKSEEEVTKVLLMKDRGSRAVRAWVVDKKGPDGGCATQRVLEGIRAFGHFRRKVAIKCDNEASLTALRGELLAHLPQGALPIARRLTRGRATGLSRTA